MSIDPLRESDEIRTGELFGTLRKKGVHVTAEIAEGGPQSIAQHLAALPERCLDDLDKDFSLLQMQSQELSLRAVKNQMEMPLAA